MPESLPSARCDGEGNGKVWLWSGPCLLPTVRQAGRELRAFLTSHGVEESEVAAWELLISEAGNNAVLHNDNTNETAEWSIRAVIGHDRIIARIHDQNQAFAFPTNPELPDDDAESGRGAFLIHSLTDYRRYEHHDGTNTLTLERRYRMSEVTDDSKASLEATLDQMTEELASCYESLSAIFRFTAEARQSSDLKDFSHRLLRHLVTVTRADCGMIRVVQGGEITTLAANGCQPPPSCSLSCSSLPLEGAAIASRQDQWIEPATFANCAGSGQVMPQAGLVHPFYHEDELMGIISLGRHHSPEPLNAGEVSIVHTFGEFFTQQVLSRRHEEAAIKASVAKREFELAAAIQKSLLPPPLPPLHGISVTGHCESALAIGGDFYDLIPWESNGYFFVIGDVMGKGVAASMMAAVTRSVFRSLPQLYQTPSRALERAAKQLYADLDRLEMFVTVAVGVADGTRKIIRIANAGHCPVILVRPDGSMQEIPPEGPPLGILKSPEFHDVEIPIVSGVRLLAYSDGLTDPRSPRPIYEQPNDVAQWMAEASKARPTIDALKSALLQRLSCADGNQDAPPLADDQTFLLLACD